MSRLVAKTTPLYLVLLNQLPIYEQLQLEEAILRVDDRNWCLMNQGSPEAIVMGISGKSEQLINYTHFKKKPVPVIKRFSGGGTVFIDHSTQFISWICNVKDSSVACISSELYQWTHTFYQQAFPHLSMQLIENDYCIGQKKFGGNAQYLAKERWLHHSCLLWDYDPQNMNYLSMPMKIPYYREQRPHNEFLCCLKDHFINHYHFQDILLSCLQQTFDVQLVDLKECNELLNRTHRKSTCYHLINNIL